MQNAIAIQNENTAIETVTETAQVQNQTNEKQKVGPKEITVQVVLNDIKRVQQKLGRNKISASDYRRHGAVSIPTVYARLGKWTTARERAVEEGQSIADKKQMGKDIRRRVKASEKKITRSEYEKKGRYGKTTVAKNFGSWTNAVDEATSVSWF